MRLSPHFTLEELCVSQTAARLGIDNTPDAVQLENLRRLARSLEVVRNVLGSPLIVTSGLRVKELNDAVPGSSSTSGHMKGVAADFISPRFGTPRAIVTRLSEESSIDFDQIILEYDAWVHFAIAQPGTKARREVLTAIRGKGYLKGIV